jgi:hypothetical protein
MAKVKALPRFAGQGAQSRLEWDPALGKKFFRKPSILEVWQKHHENKRKLVRPMGPDYFGRGRVFPGFGRGRESGSKTLFSLGGQPGHRDSYILYRG